MELGLRVNTKKQHERDNIILKPFVDANIAELMDLLKGSFFFNTSESPLLNYRLNQKFLSKPIALMDLGTFDFPHKITMHASCIVLKAP